MGVWSAADASELDQLLAGLPAFAFMTIQVEAFALHYLEAGESGSDPDLRPVRGCRHYRGPDEAAFGG